MKPIYELKLHEKLMLSFKNSIDYEVTRVPGGWIYQPLVKILAKGPSIQGKVMQLTNVMPLPPVFVPFHPEIDTYDTDATITE